MVFCGFLVVGNIFLLRLVGDSIFVMILECYSVFILLYEGLLIRMCKLLYVY